METQHLLLGSRRGARQRYGVVAVVLGLLSAVVPIGIRVSGALSGPGGDTEGLGVALLLLLLGGVLALVVPIAAGYHGAGLVVCIAIPTGLILGLNVAFWTVMDAFRWTLWQWSGPPIGLLLGLPAGTAGYLVGVALRRFR